MLFNSFEFIFLFLPVTYAIWRVLCKYRKTHAALIGLLACSLFFYGYWNPPYIVLLFGSIAVNYLIQNRIAKLLLHNSGGGDNSSKYYLLLGIILNLAIIGYFKYANFFAENIFSLFGIMWHAKRIFLPLGISFFTFQQIACLVDTYKGKIGIISPYRYALFVSFFPQLIAGPIVLADTLIPQFDNKRIFCLSYKNIGIGILLFTIGLFKKVVIADTFSPWVATAFNSNHTLTFIEAWGGALSYTFQIYFDFSGYSDMALGLGSFFNIGLPANFNSPYKSTSIIDFWRRWHITLSNFLKEYLYIPLGGNRKGKLRRYVNLVLTMLLGGLWHGAGWTFVIWGGLHGLFLTINHLWREHKLFEIPKPISWFITCICITIAWVFFRANSIDQAIEIIKGMFGMNGVVIPQNYLPQCFHVIMTNIGIIIEPRQYMVNWFLAGKKEIAVITTALCICIMTSNSAEIQRRIFNKPRHYVCLIGLATGFIIFGTLLFSVVEVNPSEFIYFNF